ncbi:MAG: ubiquinone-binding protein [Gammaproteobacteria bacterium]|nr:MAG: ubiquinone-binding protein [Gammaproteobacteria bacterium]
MFKLVEDCNHYPDFLPFCRQAVGQYIGENELHGTLLIHKGPFKKSFTTHNTMYRDETPARIDIQLVNGPFKRLEGEWRFTETADGCEVTLDLHYDMQSGLLNSALSGVFEWIAKAMVEAFCQESERIYGQSID